MLLLRETSVHASMMLEVICVRLDIIFVVVVPLLVEQSSNRVSSLNDTLLECGLLSIPQLQASTPGS